MLQFAWLSLGPKDRIHARRFFRYRKAFGGNIRFASAALYRYTAVWWFSELGDLAGYRRWHYFLATYASRAYPKGGQERDLRLIKLLPST